MSIVSRSSSGLLLLKSCDNAPVLEGGFAGTTTLFARAIARCTIALALGRCVMGHIELGNGAFDTGERRDVLV
jgi:hypothetical protein